MKKKLPSWSPAEDLKLIKGLKDGYSFAALTDPTHVIWTQA